MPSAQFPHGLCEGTVPSAQFPHGLCEGTMPSAQFPHGLCDGAIATRMPPGQFGQVDGTAPGHKTTISPKVCFTLFCFLFQHDSSLPLAHRPISLPPCPLSGGFLSSPARDISRLCSHSLSERVICVSMYVCTHVSMCGACMCIFMIAFLCINVCICVSVSVCAFMYACMYAFCVYL